MIDLRVGPLVRAVSATSVVIWAELTSAATITITARAQTTGHEITVSGKTVLVGGHYFIALQLQSLQSATWYEYQITTTEPYKLLTETLNAPVHYKFRTLHSPEQQTPAQPLRIAYGSCRKSEEAIPDAFISFGAWLRMHQEEQNQCWPDILLLIGDQIYADQPPAEIGQRYPHMKQGAASFEDFSLLYEHAWTYHPDVRQLFATIPTYMIFDDHEVTNNLNFTPTWRAKMLEKGQEHVLIDGLVAYWLYQGWGNLDPQQETMHPLLDLMQAASESGEDVLERLRVTIKADIYQQQPLTWHYQIPTQPPIFVMNARTERTTVSNPMDERQYGPMSIIGQHQLLDVQKWLATTENNPAILVSSVPVLLPPAIGYSEYIMGQRPLYSHRTLFGWLSLPLTRIQQRISEHMSFDHWPLYAKTWREFLQTIRDQHKDVLILSGDVHFSYSLKARYTSTQADSTIYQFVSTPLQNALDKASQSKIELQGHIKRLIYGGLRHQILPLQSTGQQVHIKDDLLYENTIAIVTIHPEQHGAYQLQQEYLGIVDGQLQIIGRTILSQ